MGLLQPHTGTLIWMLIAFLTVLFILKKFAWKPILSSLKERDLSIEKALKSADNARKEIKKLEGDNQKVIAEAKAEREVILKEARELKESIINDAKNKASGEAAKIVEQAKAAVKNEKELAMKEIKTEVAKLSVYVAEKILKTKLADKQENIDLVDKILKDIEVN